MVRGKHEPGEFAARRMLDRLQLQEPAELTTTHAHKLLEVLPNTLAEEAYLPLLDVHVVRDRCAACRDCLVLETTFLFIFMSTGRRDYSYSWIPDVMTTHTQQYKLPLCVATKCGATNTSCHKYKCVATKCGMACRK